MPTEVDQASISSVPSDNKLITRLAVKHAKALWIFTWVCLNVCVISAIYSLISWFFSLGT